MLRTFQKNGFDSYGLFYCTQTISITWTVFKIALAYRSFHTNHDNILPKEPNEISEYSLLHTLLRNTKIIAKAVSKKQWLISFQLKLHLWK